MQLQTAQRKRARIKMALQAPSGGGKTFSALQVGYGLCGDWSKIAVIDTENHSAELYAHLGEFKVVSLVAPFSPERYISALELCEKAGMEVVIIDSITHEWENLLEFHGSMAGNSYTNWNKITPMHNAFVQRILQSPVHTICTMRTKQDYVLNEKNGRMVPEKVGLKSVQRDGLEYEFTLVFDLDMKNMATASKDETGLFYGRLESYMDRLKSIQYEIFGFLLGNLDLSSSPKMVQEFGKTGGRQQRNTLHINVKPDMDLPIRAIPVSISQQPKMLVQKPSVSRKCIDVR